MADGSHHFSLKTSHINFSPIYNVPTSLYLHPLLFLSIQNHSIAMGNCSALGKPKRKSIIMSCAPKGPKPMCKCNHHEVLRVMKTDGKILEYTRPMLVKNVLMNFPGYGIGLSKRPLRQLPLNYELKVGHVYYLLPLSSSDYSSSSLGMEGTSSGTKRIKVIITKQQLEELLSKKISVEEKLLEIQKESMSRWRPVLETIPEGSEQACSFFVV